ncbi:MAG: restriction endonuclease subunit S, partial [Gemmatimonadota bacterium]|nr:restriction endonuclease subunit S [Gemmatimonadota bacterium]
RRTLVPLPPVDEQRRIVEKVDQLMALCDELVERQQRRAAARVRLNRASLHHLTAATDDAGLAGHWQRIRDNFHLLYDAQETVAELRQSILQLAVRGKLVPQDPSDEPASVLLERARKAKAVLTEEMKIRSARDVRNTGTSDSHFAFPSSWEVARIGQFAHILGGKRLPAGTSYADGPTPRIYIQVTNMKNGTIVEDQLKYVEDDAFQQIARYIIERDDLYITIAGTIGQVGEVPEKFHGMNLTENAARLVFREIDKSFLRLTMQSDFVQDQLQEKTNQLAQPKLALHRIADSLVPVPPLAEQRRIVEKVNQLMALCDELEAKLTRSRTKAEKLASAVVHHLTAA